MLLSVLDMPFKGALGTLVTWSPTCLVSVIEDEFCGYSDI